MAEALVDNDVLYKTAMYGLMPQLLTTAPHGITRFEMLEAAKFMILKKLAKKPPSRGKEKAIEEFQIAVTNITALEPTTDEIKFAGELEYQAQTLDLELDGGESLLCAILLLRERAYIFTGDKRAIVAVGGLLNGQTAQGLAHKVVCLEQLFIHFVQRIDPDSVRAMVCAEPVVDNALTNCFSCRSTTSTLASWMDGLGSYIGSLQDKAPNVLADT